MQITSHPNFLQKSSSNYQSPLGLSCLFNWLQIGNYSRVPKVVFSALLCKSGLGSLVPHFVKGKLKLAFLFVCSLFTYWHVKIAAETETKESILTSSYVHGKGWGQKEKRESEDEMNGWHYQCNGHELEHTLGDGEDKEAGCAAVYGVTKSWTWLGNWKTNVHISVAYYLLSNYFKHALIDTYKQSAEHNKPPWCSLFYPER